MTKTLIAALVAATALLAPAVSHAATVSLENGTIVYRGEGAEGNSLLVSTSQPWGDPNTYMLLDDSAPQTIVSGPCFKSESWDPSVLCPLDPSQPLRIEGSAGNDRLSIFSNDVPDAKPIQIHGGAGNDEIEDVFVSTAGRVLTGGPGNDLVEGHGGNDDIDGGDGNDTVDGGVGDDVVRGGPGDDEMWGDHYKDPGADLLDGGPGTDTTEEWSIPDQLDRQPRVNVTLDGAANDGRPGEGDNVVGIERLSMYVVGDFVGTEGPDQIKLVNPGNQGPSSLTGRGGDDVLVGYDFDDAVDGGAGNDTVEGGRGNDTVTGGPGRDTIYGDATSSHCTWYSCKIPFGNDTIQARDGEQDNIDCGIGTDTAIVDTIDVVANCESVDGQAPGKDTDNGTQVAFTVKGKASVRALASKGLRVAVPCPAACTVSGTLTADRRTARKVGTSKLGKGSAKAKAAGTAQLKLKLTPKVKRRFKKLAKATVTVRVKVTAGGAAKTGSQTLKLRR
jgi:Ca2+-binding RTX toxin-like protein